jgi:hypothetical protein
VRRADEDGDRDEERDAAGDRLRDSETAAEQLVAASGV